MSTVAPFRNCIECLTPVGCRLVKICGRPANPVTLEPVNVPPAAKEAPVAANVEVAGPAAEVTLEGAARGATTAEAPLAVMRLCRDCKSHSKSITQSPLMALCKDSELPVNLVTGDRIFPCIIARGYDQLCGPLGRRWKYKNK